MKKVGRFASEVYRIINANSHITAGEAFEIYKINHPDTIRSRNEVAKRISELQKAGLVQKVNTTTCAYTGSLATTWAVTGANEGVRFSTEAAETNKGLEPASAYQAPQVNSFGCSAVEDEDDDDDCPSINEPDYARLSEGGGERCDYNEHDCDGCGHDHPVQLNEMSREEKASEIARMAGEPCVAMDVDDVSFLRACARALDTIETRPVYRTVFKAFGLNGKVKQLRKALRYF
jgi:hypothetical protein